MLGYIIFYSIILNFLFLKTNKIFKKKGDNESYHKSTDYYPRFIFDFSFYLIVTLIMTNMIYGVVVDSFAELRDHH